MATGDDSIALNCPEGYSGNISRVAVTNCTFNSLSLMRLYTYSGGGNKFSIDTVNVSNCKASVYEGAFLIGVMDGSLPNALTSLSVSDCRIQGPTVLAIAENFGTITLKNVDFVPSQLNTAWVDPQLNHMCAFVRPSPLYGSVACIGSNLTFENCKIHKNGNLQAAAVILDNGSVIDNLVFNGFGVESPVPELLKIGRGSIHELVIESLDPTGVTTLVSAGGFSDIGLIAGAGVLATGWEFPDTIMASGVPFLSASSGTPSIVQAGQVVPYHP